VILIVGLSPNLDLFVDLAAFRRDPYRRGGGGRMILRCKDNRTLTLTPYPVTPPLSGENTAA